jgi:hypothetical protein
MSGTRKKRGGDMNKSEMSACLPLYNFIHNYK